MDAINLSADPLVDVKANALACSPELALFLGHHIRNAAQMICDCSAEMSEAKLQCISRLRALAESVDLLGRKSSAAPRDATGTPPHRHHTPETE